MLSRTFYNALLVIGTLLGLLITTAAGLGSTCSTPLTQGSAAAGDPFWLQSISHQGISAFNSNPSGYKVFRNVKDYGAKGDGTTDDTAAINSAISSGGRCGQGCESTTVSPAVVYFPAGTYKVSTPIIAIYQTQLIGDAKRPPTLLAASNFVGIALIDADPYIGSGQYYVNQNNFFRSVRNFVIDLRSGPSSVTGIHWQVSQATSLFNVVFQMSTASGNQNQGIFMENGSGGMLGDLVFNGGNIGATFGNQQFTVRNLTFNGCNTGITINNAQVGFDLQTGGVPPKGPTDQGVGSEVIVDGVVTNTPVFIRWSASPLPYNGTIHGALVLNNIKLTNVPTAVGVLNGATLLSGGTTTIDTWGLGNVFKGTNSAATYTQGNLASIQKGTGLTDSAGRIFGRRPPQYEGYAPGDFISVRSQGAKGDGKTDDTAAIKAVFTKYAGCKIIFFDAGTYLVSDTITIPAGTQVVGEFWSVIMGTGSQFTDYNNPRVVVKVGDSGSKGIVEITDMIFTTRGPAAGAIVTEWNVGASSQGSAGAWNTHMIIGGTSGSNLLNSQCPKTGNGGNNCFAAFLGVHLTSASSAYLEGTWVWLADHDLDSGGSTQISLWSGRGVLSESQGPVWFVGTGEHHVNYQYYLKNAKNHYIGLAQTETPYYQPNPVPPAPFITNSAYDPSTLGPGSAWALAVDNSQNILIFGAGFYSFFSNYATTCENSYNCQSQIINLDSSSTIAIYGLSTVASTYQLSVNNQGVINQSLGRNGFASTVTAWTRS